MKKTVASIIILALMLCLLTACEPDYIGGKPMPPITENVNIIPPNTSDKFNEEEITSAFNTVINDFAFSGCELLDIWYDEDYSDKESSNQNTIIILSNFYVQPTGAHQSFNEDSTYKDWAWILVREDDSSPWSIKDYGVL